ncbi:hypothetical protein HanIR_Chr05g0224951 [Helianthus annuus]|nr:hypothetical protein HanIR_Chr05g0224951 [Helianthus annuus]
MVTTAGEAPPATQICIKRRTGCEGFTSDPDTRSFDECFWRQQQKTDCTAATAAVMVTLMMMILC